MSKNLKTFIVIALISLVIGTLLAFIVNKLIEVKDEKSGENETTYPPQEGDISTWGTGTNSSFLDWGSGTASTSGFGSQMFF